MQSPRAAVEPVPVTEAVKGAAGVVMEYPAPAFVTIQTDRHNWLVLFQCKKKFM